MSIQTNFIGTKLYEARKKSNLSQAELAQQIAISPQAVGKWERGESLPDLPTLNRLAALLGVDLNYFSENFGNAPVHSIQETTSYTAIPAAVVEKATKKFDWNWDMSRGNWVDADFSGLKNLKDKFSESNMKNCIFANAELRDLTLSSNNIEKCDFTGADLRNCKINSSNLLSNQFVKCTFIDAVFTKNNIGHCNFSSADFSGAEFMECNFEKNILVDSNWNYTAVKRSNLSDIVFEGTLANCHFEHCSFWNVKFENATLLNTFFKYNKRFKKVVFSNCKVDKLTYAFLKNNLANLEGMTVLES